MRAAPFLLREKPGTYTNRGETAVSFSTENACRSAGVTGGPASTSRLSSRKAGNMVPASGFSRRRIRFDLHSVEKRISPGISRPCHGTRRTDLFLHRADDAAHHGLSIWPICPKTGFASPGYGATAARNFLPLPAARHSSRGNKVPVLPSSALLRPARRCAAGRLRG